MMREPQLPPERLAELRTEVLETMCGAVPGSEAVRALDAQLVWIDEQIAASEQSA